MSRFKWLISALIGILAFSWALTLHDYFYGRVRADAVSMFLTMVVSFFLLNRLASLLTKRTIAVAVVLMALPFLLYPSINRLVLFTPHSWLLVHLFLVLTVFGVTVLHKSNLIYMTLLAYSLVFLYPFNFQKEQLRFYDRLESSVETRFGEAQIVQWKEDFWMYYNGQLQFSTIDGHMFSEAYVQPIMQFVRDGAKVLLIGGDNGLLESELSKFPILLTILPNDPEFHAFARNSTSISNTPVKDKMIVETTDVFEYLANNKDEYDIVIVDMPDPLNLNYKQYYTNELYELIYASLTKNGMMITQSGDFYKNGFQVQKVWNSLGRAGFHTLPFQCQIPTIGHWSWVLGAKGITPEEMKNTLSKITESESVWWNQEAADMMFSSGKHYFSNQISTINTLNEPAQ